MITAANFSYLAQIACLRADLNKALTDLAEARAQIAEDRDEMTALIEAVLDARRYAGEVAAERATAVLRQAAAENRPGDICDYDDPDSIDAMNAAIDAEGDIAPGHPEALRDLDPDSEALLAELAESIATKEQS